MKLRLAFAPITPLLWCLAAEVPRTDEWQGVTCIEEIGIPRYSAVARVAVKTGTVRAQIKIGENGQLADVALEAPDRWLATDVRAWLEHTARFRAACAGGEVILLVTYRLEGEATHYPTEVIRFRPPNHFIIISQPRLPHIQYKPVEPPKEAEKRSRP